MPQGPEVRNPNETEEKTQSQEKLEDLDPKLEELRKEASSKINAFLNDPNYSKDLKIEQIQKKTEELNAKIDKWQQEEEEDLQGYLEQFNKAQGTPLGEQYNQAWLDKATDDIRHRYSHWRREERVKIDLLNDALIGLRPARIENPKSESPSENIGTEKPAAVTEAEEQPSETPSTEDIKTDENQIDDEQKKKEAKLLEEKTQEAKIFARKLKDKLEEIALPLGFAKSRISEIDSRQPWFRPLNNFLEDNLQRRRSLMINLVEECDSLVSLAQNEDAYNRKVEEIQLGFRRLENDLQEDYQSMRVLRRKTSDHLQEDLDRDHPVNLIANSVRKASEIAQEALRF